MKSYILLWHTLYKNPRSATAARARQDKEENQILLRLPPAANDKAFCSPNLANGDVLDQSSKDL
jgi:hypothetical protein